MDILVAQTLNLFRDHNRKFKEPLLEHVNIHKDLQNPFVKGEFKRAKEKYSLKVEMHPNSLARQLANRCSHSRLRRADKPAMD